MPECVVLVAAVGGAGGSSRDRLVLLAGERDLYCLPLSHVFTPAVLFQSCSSLCIIPFILGFHFSPLESFSYVETVVNCWCCFIHRLLVSQILTEVLTSDVVDDGFISVTVEWEKADAGIQKGSLHLV